MPWRPDAVLAMTQHTPGTWTVRRSGLATLVVGPDGAIAKMLGSSLADADEFLIAAAPDLLAALESVIHDRPSAHTDAIWEQAVRAIAKARGEAVAS